MDRDCGDSGDRGSLLDIEFEVIGKEIFGGAFGIGWKTFVHGLRLRLDIGLLGFFSGEERISGGFTRRLLAVELL